MPYYEVEIIIRTKHRITVKAESAEAAKDKALGDMDYSREPESIWQEEAYAHEITRKTIAAKRNKKALEGVK